VADRLQDSLQTRRDERRRERARDLRAGPTDRTQSSVASR
jgi:hypothetical protein